LLSSSRDLLLACRVPHPSRSLRWVDYRGSTSYRALASTSVVASLSSRERSSSAASSNLPLADTRWLEERKKVGSTSRHLI
jgi:hypothetical protein